MIKQGCATLRGILTLKTAQTTEISVICKTLLKLLSALSLLCDFNHTVIFKIVCVCVVIMDTTHLGNFVKTVHLGTQCNFYCDKTVRLGTQCKIYCVKSVRLGTPCKFDHFERGRMGTKSNRLGTNIINCFINYYMFKKCIPLTTTLI